MLNAFKSWSWMLLLAIANGAARDLLYAPHLSELAAHQLSTVLCLLLLSAVIFRHGRLCPPVSRQAALRLGLLWAALTLAFEFLFFHYAGGHSWAELLANYDLGAGRIWLLVPLWLALGPLLLCPLKPPAPAALDAAGRPQPRNKPRPGNRPYIFKDLQDFTIQTDWRLAEPFIAEWLEISVDGRVTVKANGSGYAWDGCTPKLSLFDLAIIGIPDGHIDVRSMLPFTYRASMVHDALYQYLDSVPIRKAAIDRLFFEMLGDFRPRHLYYFMVRNFGGRGIVQHGLSAIDNDHCA